MAGRLIVVKTREKTLMLKVKAVLVAAALSFFGVSLAHSQSFPRKYLSAATTNSTLVNAGPTLLKMLVSVNTTTTLYYLKLYNKATAPTCGTDTPLWTVPVPYGASNAGGGVAIPAPDGLQFPLGLGLCLTGGIADNDTTSAATGVAINLGITGYP
jgi:hypothetical protein